MATFTNTIETSPARRSTRLSPHRRLLNRAVSSPAAPKGRGIEPEVHRPVSLLDEARRRMKSNMMAYISLLRLASSATEHSSAEALLTGMENRLQSMAALHRALCRAGNFDEIDLAVYLRRAASLQNSPSHSPLRGGWVAEPDGASLVWSRDEDENAVGSPEGSMDLEAALESVPPQWQDLARRAVYACAIAVPPSLYRWRSPQTGTAGRGHLAKPGEVGIRVRHAADGVAVELSFSDCGLGLPALFDLKAQRALGLELVSVLARLVQGSLSDHAPSEAAFSVAFVPSHRSFTNVQSAA